jgi:hypothetical protein
MQPTINQTIDSILGERIVGSSRKRLDNGQASVEGRLAADVCAVVVVCALGGVDCGCEALWRRVAGQKTVESKE